MIQYVPRCWSAPINLSSSLGTGGFSKSVCKVPSKSVEMSLIGGFILKRLSERTHAAVSDRICNRLAKPTCVRNTFVRYRPLSKDMSLQEQYDDAMFDFTQGELDGAITKFEKILEQDPTHFDAQLSVGMAHYRKGDFARAIAEGHKAEKLKPHEQLVHTNLSLFYMKSGDKKTAEHHGLQARIASWRTPVDPAAQGSTDPDLELAKPPLPPPRPTKMPEMPWKKNKPLGAAPSNGTKENHG
jgi:hypothetical protein